MDRSIFTTLKPYRLSEEVYRQIREAIYSGQYRPGDKLPSERLLCEAFGVGRPVIREALRSVENLGLISVRKGARGGAFVRTVDTSVLTGTLESMVRLDNLSLQDLTDARMAIELGALQLVMERIEDSDIEALKANIAEGRDNVERGVRGKRNAFFHVLMLRASRNPLLAKVGEALFDLINRILEGYEYNIERSRLVIEEHEELVRLIEEGSYEKTRTFLERHIRELLDKVKVSEGEDRDRGFGPPGILSPYVTSRRPSQPPVHGESLQAADNTIEGG